jgi:hypothetical protein
MVTDVLTILNHARVLDFAAARRVPAIYEFGFLARDGGLMSYGPDGMEATARVADLVEHILRGAKPAELPFEQPTRFEFVINFKSGSASTCRKRYSPAPTRLSNSSREGLFSSRPPLHPRCAANGSKGFESGLLGKIPDERRSENRQRQKRKPGAGPGATRRIEGNGSTGVRLIS